MDAALRSQIEKHITAHPKDGPAAIIKALGAEGDGLSKNTVKSMKARLLVKRRKLVAVDDGLCWMDVGELSEWARNPRVISQDAVLAVATSLTRFGFQSPIVIWKSKRRIVAGHTRYRAVAWLKTHQLNNKGQWEPRPEDSPLSFPDAPGPGMVPLRMTEFRSEAEATAFAIADNRTGEIAEWDDAALTKLLQEVDDEGMDLTGLGFSDEELDVLLNAQVVPGVGDNRPQPPKVGPSNLIPANVPPKYNLGDVVTLGRHTLHVNDCLVMLRGMEENSVDAIVTDPPYGLGKAPDIRKVLAAWLEGDKFVPGSSSGGFMGRDWDAFCPGPEVWAEVYRVLKPGGHIVCFSGQRTVDVMGIALRLGGFEVRDLFGWITYQGFPKSLDISKAIDRQRDDREEILEVTAWIRTARNTAGLKNADLDAPFGFMGMAGHWTSSASQPAVPTIEQVPTLLKVLGAEPPERIRRLLLELNGRKGEPGPNWWKREVVGKKTVTGPEGTAAGYRDGIARLRGDSSDQREIPISAPATDDAKRWSGWGTALKPSLEPALIARKPLSEDTVAANVLKWGTGGLNIDGCRYAEGDAMWPGPQEDDAQRLVDGRWPANIGYVPKPSRDERDRGTTPTATGAEAVGRTEGSAGLNSPRAGAGRTAAAVGNLHPTVKPVRLMRWLVRLLTPPGGTVLDPFCGSGTTLLAAEVEGFTCIAAEMEPPYCDIIEARFSAWEARPGDA